MGCYQRIIPFVEPTRDRALRGQQVVTELLRDALGPNLALPHQKVLIDIASILFIKTIIRIRKSNVWVRIGMGKAAGTNGAVSRKTTEIDIEIGRRLRFRRIQLNLSQNALAEKLSIAQAQLVKYETGANRLSASRLSDCARFLEVSVTYFFDSYIEPTPESPRAAVERELLILCRKLSNTSLAHLLRIAQTFEESGR